MKAPRTYATTSTRTRLEVVEDQFEHFLRFGGIDDDTIARVRRGVHDRKMTSVGLYACDAAGKRVLEVELAVDWAAHAQLSVKEPKIATDLPGWDGSMSPEVKVAGRRFAEAARKLDAEPRCWVRFARSVYQETGGLAAACREYGFDGTGKVPTWAGKVEERSEQVFDVSEASVYLRAVRPDGDS